MILGGGILAATVGITLVSYVLYGIYELFNVKSPTLRAPRVLFALGTLGVICATALLIHDCAISTPGAASILMIVLACVSLALLMKALFFSLPAGTYAQPGARRPAFRGGLYALCRHPGVLFYALMYLFFLAAFPSAPCAVCVAVLIACDVAYMMLQDRWSFPRLFSDYDDYRLGTPLVIPTPASLRAWADGRRAREA